jgi:hypothetical protein
LYGLTHESGYFYSTPNVAEHQIPDSQFGFCPTRNTNQPIFILRHILATAKKKKMVFTAFLDLLAAYDSIPREKLWRHLQKIKAPQYLRDIIQTCTQDASTFLLMATKFPGRLRPTKA